MTRVSSVRSKEYFISCSIFCRNVRNVILGEVSGISELLRHYISAAMFAYTCVIKNV
jgi:hypothetical protein